MSYELNQGALSCAGTITVDDAEGLLQLLQGQSGIPADLGACEHIHAASLQVMLAAGIRIREWPAHPSLAAWLQSAFQAVE